MMRKIQIPTGFIFTDEYSKGELETLSIGDYGRVMNVHAEFLGLTKEISGVPNGSPINLSEKWVITLSTQYGCPMKCVFCDVPKVKFRGNASFFDLKNQLLNAVGCFGDVHYTDRLNVHFARMGEPVFNSDVLTFAEWLYRDGKLALQIRGLRIETIHPVFTTCMPRSTLTRPAIERWCQIKNDLYNGQAGLQLSINSTDDNQRYEMFGGMAMELDEIAETCALLPPPVGRKYCLNFALADEYVVDADYLRELFDPNDWMVKITPIHNNQACEAAGIKTGGGYTHYRPYREAENKLIAAGFDVLVFIPSMDEEDGLITCGNVVLSGKRPDNALCDLGVESESAS